MPRKHNFKKAQNYNKNAEAESAKDLTGTLELLEQYFNCTLDWRHFLSIKNAVSVLNTVVNSS